MRKAEFLLDKLNIFPQILTPDLSSCNKNVYKLFKLNKFVLLVYNRWQNKIFLSESVKK